MMMFVFVGLRYIWVVSCPFSWRLRSISKNAIFPSSSASRVNFTRGWTALRHSLKAVSSLFDHWILDWLDVFPLSLGFPHPFILPLLIPLSLP